MTDLPLIHPDRELTAFRPLKALHHFRNLVADKEDTEQVFHIVRALSGRDFIRRAKAFWSSERGKAVLAEKRSLVERLDDHDTLKKLPAGTVGRVYVDFMEREGLTAQGLADEYTKFATKINQYDDLLEHYGFRLRDTHDLFHILTGYGRDALGEASVLAFSYSQNPNLGVIFIAYAGGREVKKGLPSAVPVFGAIREAQRNGKQAEKIAHQDIMALLAEPLEEARKRLNIKPPTQYNRAHELMLQDGLDPYDLMKQTAVA
ncbi:MAG: Coq4 family protein [Sphingorhabdus sp.]